MHTENSTAPLVTQDPLVTSGQVFHPSGRPGKTARMQNTSLSAPIPTVKNLAREAEFQLSVAKENLSWLAAVARAIARDAQTSNGRDTGALLGLVNYLDDTGFAGVADAISEFKALADNVEKPAIESINVPTSTQEFAQ